MNADPEDAPPEDDRASSVKAMDWASRVTSSSLMMVLPALGGYWVDQKLGTLILFTFLGLVIGMAGAGWQLYLLVNHQEFQGTEYTSSRDDSNTKDDSKDKS